MSAERFIGPLFKRLTQTDVGDGLAHVSGPTMLREIRDFLPRPFGAERRVNLRVRLVDEGPQGREALGEVIGTLQAQGGGAKSVEVYLSDIGRLRTRSEEGDLLLIEPAAEEPDLLRVTRIARTSPRFSAMDARTRGRDAGLLSGGVLPRTWEHGRLRPVNDKGQVLIADFTLKGAWPRFEVTFESKDGHGRNTDYEGGLELVLSRLGNLGSTLLEARITSDRMLAKVAAGVDPTFAPAGSALPLALAGQDPSRLRKALVLAGSKVGVPSSKNGNTTRRMTLVAEITGPRVSLADLEERLAGVELAPGRDEVSADIAPIPPEAPLVMLDDLTSVDAALGVWRDTLRSASRSINGALRWLDVEGFGFRFDASARRKGAIDVRIGVRETGAPWSVEINSPRIAADANGHSTIALDQLGRRFLIRQGRLQANPDSDGDIKGEQFRELSGLTPIEVLGERTPQKREWFVVADLDGSPAEIRSQTARFIHACAMARARSLGMSVPASAPPLEVSGERGGSYLVPALPSRPERLAQRIHGDVWQALFRALETRGVRLLKLRHEQGYEVDGIIQASTGPILIEIKSKGGAADVYEGVGQLILYSKMMNLADCRRVLLMPIAPSPALVSALATSGIILETFSIEGDDAVRQIHLSKSLLSFCET